MKLKPVSGEQTCHYCENRAVGELEGEKCPACDDPVYICEVHLRLNKHLNELDKKLNGAIGVAVSSLKEQIVASKSAASIQGEMAGINAPFTQTKQ